MCVTSTYRERSIRSVQLENKLFHVRLLLWATGNINVSQGRQTAWHLKKMLLQVKDATGFLCSEQNQESIR